ncbi:MAG TPA: hypothetical protein VHN14_33815 [Kofleriaceae bacterium]|jgi:hypothetical protein|nr:hypothetical protein [Kofleriaceae bacterium]
MTSDFGGDAHVGAVHVPVMTSDSSGDAHVGAVHVGPRDDLELQVMHLLRSHEWLTCAKDSRSSCHRQREEVPPAVTG